MQHQHCSISCQMASNQQLNTNYSNKENNKMEILKIFQLEKITGMDSLETRSKLIFQILKLYLGLARDFFNGNFLLYLGNARNFGENLKSNN